MSRVREFCEQVTAGAVSADVASGVYVIVNKVNLRAYIGQSSNILSRMATHRRMLREGQHHNAALQADWATHGEDKFVFAPFATAPDPLALERELIEESVDAGHCYNAGPQGGPRPGSGRKPLPPEDQTRPRSIRLNDERWAKLKRLIAAGKLNQWIDRARIEE